MHEPIELVALVGSQKVTNVRMSSHGVLASDQARRVWGRSDHSLLSEEALSSVEGGASLQFIEALRSTLGSDLEARGRRQRRRTPSWRVPGNFSRPS